MCFRFDFLIFNTPTCCNTNRQLKGNFLIKATILFLGLSSILKLKQSSSLSLSSLKSYTDLFIFGIIILLLIDMFEVECSIGRISLVPSLNFKTVPPLCTAVVCSGRNNKLGDQLSSKFEPKLSCFGIIGGSHENVDGFGNVSLIRG